LAISRKRKEELLTEYTDQLGESRGVVFAHYLGLTVSQMEGLRNEVRDNEGLVYVVKNTIFQRAVDDHGVEVPDDLMTGPTLVAFCHQDVPPLAKIFKEFAGDVDEGEFTIRGAVVEDQFYDAAQAETLAELPTRDELFAQVLGTINAPATQMAGVVAGGVRQVLNVLQAYIDKLEEGGASAEAAA
jgi:large subunit ribosomal protein L10